ncbi:MAG: hypothetical protein KGI90_12485 [Burkholderiales bacterium]|nr:hypothetical protein [Burkholderiales bacterium]
MTITTAFEGQVTLYSTRAGFAGPKVQSLAFQAQFDGAAWTVAPGDFRPVVVPDIVALGQRLTLTVTLAQPAAGQADPLTGQASLQAQFRFELTGLPLPLASLLPLVLDSGAAPAARWPGGPVVQGQRIQAPSGQMTLAGVGWFQGGPLDGDQAAVLLAGGFTPRPW